MEPQGRRTSPRVRDWGNGLPLELLECIAGKLTSAGDAAAFRVINRAWNAALPFSSFAPVQMLPFDPDSPEGAVTFSRSTRGGETFTKNLPAVRGKVVCGSSCGWVALMDEAGSVTLLNSFTGATAELPPADELVAKASRRRARASVVDGRRRWVLESSSDDQGQDQQQRVISLDEMREVFFREIVLSSPPDSGSDCVAVAVLAASKAVLFCRVGDVDRGWTLLNMYTWMPGCVSTAVHCRGNKFLVIGYNGEINMCECGTDGIAVRVAPMGGTVVPPRIFCRRGYIMVDGELHLVGTSKRRFQNGATTYRTHVYKCNVLARMPAWTRVKKLEWTSQKKGKPRKNKKFNQQMTLLVSKRFTTGCSGPTVSGLASNSVYFCEPMYATPEDPHHRIEISHVGSGTSEYQQRIQQGSEQALCWIQPNIWTQRRSE